MAVDGDQLDARFGLRTYTVSRFVQTPPYSGMFTAAAIRALIFNSEDRYSASGQVVRGNGLARAIIRIGRRVYIDADEFDRWVLAHRGAPAPATKPGISIR